MSKAMFEESFIFLFQERWKDGARLQSPGRFGAAFGTCIERRLQIQHSSFINGSERILNNYEGYKKEKEQKNVYHQASCAQEG